MSDCIRKMSIFRVFNVGISLFELDFLKLTEEINKKCANQYYWFAFSVMWLEKILCMKMLLYSSLL